MKVKGGKKKREEQNQTKIFIILYTLKKIFIYYNFSLKVTEQLSPKFIQEV